MAGLLGKIMGGGIAEPIEAVGNILDKLFTSDDERLSRQEAQQRVLQRPAMVQAEINKVEASHRSVFVAGWRPFIGWTCGAALAYNFIARDLIVWAFAAFAPTMPVPPALQMEELLTVLLGLLGLGTLRTVEKIGGRAK